MKTGLMKNFIKFIISLFAVSVFFSCASTSVDLTSYKKTALVSVYGNSMIPWYSNSMKGSDEPEYTEGIISGAINRAVNEADPEVNLAEQRVVHAALILEEVLKTKGINILTPSSAPDCSIYTKDTYKEKKLASKYSGRGYKILDSLSKKYRTELVNKNGCDSMLFTNFKFEKIQKSRKVFLRVTLSAKVTDMEGSVIFRNKYTATSDEGVEMDRASRYDHDELCSLSDSTVLKAINLFMESSESQTLVLEKLDLSKADEEAVIDEATKAKIEAARAMLKDGVAPEQIAKWQNLPLELVQELAQE
ncbi:hypothetical protein [Treponema sp.]|uniref:hypothetical protein n=1 Tax=Treponema sp. TaxID=166 RepID=UPI0025E298A3|nr:hypothetical protein [Treponema sp.]MCR5218169.1 hypothetical protein [Treponema sp.]